MIAETDIFYSKGGKEMCTAVTYKTEDYYFGRNLDLHYSYEEKITITPRNFPLHFRTQGISLDRHYAIIGMATTMEGYPLYYDGANEKGVAMAGLNFPGNAVFKPYEEGKTNISPYEFIPWILSQCKNMAEVRTLLSQMNLVDVPFRADLPLAPLHYIIAHEEESITIEAVEEGLKIYENPLGVLTNNPPFPYHLQRLQDFMHVTNNPPENLFSSKIDLRPNSLGMGGIGLPGDYSSSSRFIRAAFVKLHSPSFTSEVESVHQFFHILSSVFQPKGCSLAEEDLYEYTIYSSCINTSEGIYYYRTYNNPEVNAVKLFLEDLEASRLLSYPLNHPNRISVQNQK